MTIKTVANPETRRELADNALKTAKTGHYLPVRASLLAVGLLALFAVSVLLGSYTVTVPDFFRILTAHVTGGEKIPGASFIVMENKLPRAVIGTMIGVAFGLAGGLFQTMLRNPLASPDVIGISSGASAAAVTATVVFGASGASVSAAALGGALGVAALIYAISRGSSLGGGGNGGNAAGNRLILAGVGIAAALQAVVSFLMSRTDIRTAADALVWLNGSLNSANWARAGVLSLSLPVLVPVVAALAGPLRILELGDDAAAGLGIRVGFTRLAVVVTAVALAAVATAAAGPVSFVAFLAGPIARRFSRKASLPASALVGALIVLSADYVAANIAPLLWRAPHCPSASSRAPSVPRSCCGSWSRPTERMPDMAVLTARNLTLKYDRRCVVDGLTAEIPEGKVTMIVGANACGKSTLLRGLSRLLKPAAGVVTLDGKDIHSRPARELARTLGLLPQHPSAPDGITVRDLVGRGRYPHQGFFRSWAARDVSQDERAVQRALEATETLDLAGRNVDELSGGQRQRVWIAMALAQETEVLLLDEPTTYLDLAHLVEVLDLVTDLNRQRGTTVAIVLHDLNLAARYADHVIAMKGGAVVALGAPGDVVTEGLVREVFGLESRVIPDPVSGTPLIIPIGRHHATNELEHVS